MLMASLPFYIFEKLTMVSWLWYCISLSSRHSNLAERVWCHAIDQLVLTDFASLVNCVGTLQSAMNMSNVQKIDLAILLWYQSWQDDSSSGWNENDFSPFHESTQ